MMAAVLAVVVMVVMLLIRVRRSPINNGHVPAMLSRQKFKAALGEIACACGCSSSL